MTIYSNVSQNSATVDGIEWTLSNATLDHLDDTHKRYAFDDTLLQVAPAQEIRLLISKTLDAVNLVDHSKFLNKRGWLAKFTGADVEAKLRFELAAQTVGKHVEHLHSATVQARHLLALFDEAKIEITIDNRWLLETVEYLEQLLEREVDGDPFLIDRFQRKLANMSVLHVANISTVQQIDFSIEILRGLIDRINEIDMTIYPLWQRNVFALLQNCQNPDEAAQLNFFSSKQMFVSFLRKSIA